MTALLVILTIILFIIIDYAVYRKKGTALVQLARDTVEKQTEPTISKEIINENDIFLPNGVFLHPKHTWAYVLQSGKVKVGVDAFISKLTGRIDKVILPPIGMEVKKGQPILNLFSGEKKLTLVSPVNGKIISVNNDLMENPELLKDPYNNGWTVIIHPTNLSADVSTLKIADDAIKILKDELKRFKEFIISFGNGNKLGLQTLQDGGMPVVGILSSLDKDKWEIFQKQFLNLE